MLAQRPEHRTHVILWEWIDGARGVLSSAQLEVAQRAKLDERLDRIQELDRLSHESTKGLIFPYKRELKKMKIRGNVALRPILVFGPFDSAHEVTFLMLPVERDNKLPKNTAERALERLGAIKSNQLLRRKYERHS